MKYLIFILLLIPIQGSPSKPYIHSYTIDSDPVTWSIASNLLVDIASNAVASEYGEQLRKAIFYHSGPSEEVIEIEKLIDKAVQEIKNHVNSAFEENRLKDIRAGIDAMQRDLREYYNNGDRKILDHTKNEGSRLFSLNKEMKGAGYSSYFIITSLYLVVLNEKAKKRGCGEKKNVIDFLVEAIDYYESTLTRDLKIGVANRYTPPYRFGEEPRSLLKGWTFNLDGRNPNPATPNTHNSDRAVIISYMNSNYNELYKPVLTTYSQEGDKIRSKWVDLLKKYVNSSKKLKKYFFEKYKGKAITSFSESKYDNEIQIKADRDYKLALAGLIEH